MMKATSDSNQLYNDVTTCIEFLVDGISNEISDAVSDLVLDGKIGLASFFSRHGMEPDGCERHVFFSSYQKDIISQVQRRLSRKGFNCKLEVEGKSILYTTRVPHPLIRIITLATLVLTPILIGAAASLNYYAHQNVGTTVRTDGYVPQAHSQTWEHNTRNDIAHRPEWFSERKPKRVVRVEPLRNA